MELAEKKSVSYPSSGFFLKVLPRERRLTLLLPFDFSEVDSTAAYVLDATAWKFLVNAVYQGGVTVRVKKPDDIAAAIPIIKQALQMS